MLCIKVSNDATHLVLSVGGNDALWMAGNIFSQETTDVRSALQCVADSLAKFKTEYRRLIRDLRETRLPLVTCTIYLSGQSQIETVRLRYNPLQAQLIPAHVTLCREDEVTDWITFEARLKKLSPFQVTLTFGVPVREDNFVFLPVQEGRNNFHDFRSAILSKEARTQTPHVTLIHPRNGTCTDQIFAEIVATVNAPFQYSFREVMLIEQENGGVWKSISKVG